MKVCPYCAEQIQSNAIKCRYCGEWLDRPATSDISSRHVAESYYLPGRYWSFEHKSELSIFG
jgi:tRNA(Ile2) C34 agmatinyltransferase TiaS